MLLTLLMLASTTAAAAPPATGDTSQRCAPTSRYAGAPDRMPKVHTLTAEPPANQEVAVVNRVDGCEKPIVVRYEVGGAPRR